MHGGVPIRKKCHLNFNYAKSYRKFYGKVDGIGSYLMEILSKLIHTNFKHKFPPSNEFHYIITLLRKTYHSNFHSNFKKLQLLPVTFEKLNILLIFCF